VPGNIPFHIWERCSARKNTKRSRPGICTERAVTSLKVLQKRARYKPSARKPWSKEKTDEEEERCKKRLITISGRNNRELREKGERVEGQA